MKLNLRFTLLCAILVLMVCSLAAVSLVALTRHRTMAKLVGERAIEQATNDVAFRVTRFLENGPAALSRIKHVIERRGIALMDAERMTDYLVAEAQASPALTWVSVSDAATGSFLGITRRDGKLILNRSVPTLNNGIAREWELQADSTWMPLTSGPGVPYDPRRKPWFALGMGTDGPRWTDPYEFAEGLAGISVVIGLNDAGTHHPAGVATADFHLREIELFLSELRVEREGRVVVMAPLSTGGYLVFGVLSALPANMQSVLPVVTERALSPTAQPEHRDGKPDVLFRDTIGGVIVDGRALAIPGGLVWRLVVLLPSADVEAPIAAATTAVFIVVCIFLLVGIAAAAWMAHAISRPIRLMSQDLVDIGELRFSRPAPPRSFIGEM
ncbi:PDC sensor domain-containing protein [Azospirillum canadense]|uniref:hypothetical protein n=1 Tax=Azospirillum canadense TaxID=403962 RepID=UPI002225F575|nr:hypothetical protein [Azospirillum canadense]MCW2242093.1 hypothetical protein [Azospirillum canadense]